MKAIKRLTIAGGKYTFKGETKTRWVNIGTLFQKDDGKYSILLNAGINLAAYATRDPGHETDVWVNLFDIEEKREDSKQASSEAPKSVIVDDVPF